MWIELSSTFRGPRVVTETISPCRRFRSLEIPVRISGPCVQENGDGELHLPDSGLDVLDDLGVGFVVAVRHVQTGDAHAGVVQLSEASRRSLSPGRWCR